jgi:transporter family-2 protein
MLSRFWHFSRLGAASLLSLVVAGQMLASSVIDHFGLLGIARHPATPSRVVGALLLVAGVVLMRR